MESHELIKEKFEQFLKGVQDLNFLQSILSQKIEENVKKESLLDSFLVKNFHRIENQRHNNEDIIGIPSGFPSLDRIIYGWQEGDLIVIASRPSVGKTAFALNLARNAVLHPTKPIPVAFFSLEMNAERIAQRILAAESEIWLEKISRGKLEEHEMKQLYARGIQPLSHASLHIDDTPGLNIEDLKSKCKIFKTAGVGLIIVDYLQLMRGIHENANREQDLSKITRELKALAKELRIPIIAISQLSRDVEKRREGNKVPQLSDLRDSGAIEQDADMVCFMYRPEYYDVTQNEMGESNRGETHIRIAKHRNGSLDTIKLKALLHIQKFIDDDSTDYGLPNLPISNSWKPVSDIDSPKLYIQTGKNMNTFNDEEDAPF